MKALAARSLALTLGLGVAVSVAAPVAHAATTGRGYVDPTYGSNGSFTASPSLEGVTAMYEQPDGKVVFGGPIPQGVELYRLNTDGTPDRTFSGDGVAPLDLGNGRGPLLEPRSVGGTWVAQVQTSSTHGAELRIDALTPSGALDPHFGRAGRVAVPAFYGEAIALREVTGGAIEVVESGDIGGRDPARTMVYRFRADGTPDPSLGGHGGITVTNFLPEQAFIRFNGAVTFEYLIYNENISGVGQLASSGAWDPNFAGDGRVNFGTGRGWGYDNGAAKGMAIDSSGRLLVRVDYVFMNNTSLSVLARLTPNGGYDTTFGDGGRAGISSVGDNDPSEILPTPSGRILVTFGDLIKAFTSSGQVDKGFHNGGEVGVGVAESPVMVVDSKNRLLIGGTAGSPTVVEFDSFLSNGSWDAGFGNNGVAHTSYSSVRDPAFVVLVGSRLIAAGDRVNESSTPRAVMVTGYLR